jgi:hypothetical protein
MMQIGFGRTIALSNKRLGCPIAHQCLNLRPVLIKFALADTLRPTELHAAGLSSNQHLFRPFGNPEARQRSGNK